MSLLDTILDAIVTDDLDLVKKSTQLIVKYRLLKDIDKDLVDDFFISLTGYSLKTLIDRSKKI